MSRDEILQIVIENIRDNVDGAEDVEIDPSQSMAVYGASSLDIVEVVSTSMRQLRIRIPRTEFRGIENIDQLVDLLAAHSDKG